MTLAWPGRLTFRAACNGKVQKVWTRDERRPKMAGVGEWLSQSRSALARDTGCAVDRTDRVSIRRELRSLPQGWRLEQTQVR